MTKIPMIEILKRHLVIWKLSNSCLPAGRGIYLACLREAAPAKAGIRKLVIGI
jgi:hypothetical protein